METKQQYSQGLEYRIEGSNAWITGIGTCTDEDLLIPAQTEDGYKIIGIKESAFEECKNIINVVIPKTIAIIEGWAFSNCTGIKSIKLHYGLQEIWQFAFENCISLTSIEIPSSVTNIGNIPNEISPEEKLLQAIFGYTYGNPFKGCKKLRSIKVNSGNHVYCDHINCLIDKQKKIVVSGCKNSILPDGDMAEIIGPYAFYDCGDVFKNGLYIFGTPQIKVIEPFAFAKCNIENLYFPNTLTRIECNAFRYCSNIREITFPTSLTYVGPWAFGECCKLYKISFPVSIKDVGDRAFEKCSNLTCVLYDKDSKITRIASGTFSECTSLMEVHLPENLEKIGSDAFYKCKNLQRIILPNNLKIIGKSAFASCEHLENIFIPKSVEYIECDAFLDCWPSLNRIECEIHIKPENWDPNWNRKKVGGSYYKVVWDANKLYTNYVNLFKALT